MNASGAAIGPLVNATGPTISGGAGFASFVGHAGGAGMLNSGAIGTLTNSGTIQRRKWRRGFDSGGAGGAGIWNAGAIGPLVNSGTIEGGMGGKGSPNGAAGDAIYSAGAHASIGPITNTGKIIGNVEIDNQATVTVNGGTGKPFGSWTGGTITIGAGNLTFASGNTALGDDISLGSGAGTVINMAALQLAAPQTIAGNFTQAPAGVLDLDFASDVAVWGAFGHQAHDARRRPRDRLDRRLHAGDARQLRHPHFWQPMGGFDALTLDGAACEMRPMDSWACGGGVRLKEEIDATRSTLS